MEIFEENHAHKARKASASRRRSLEKDNVFFLLLVSVNLNNFHTVPFLDKDKGSFNVKDGGQITIDISIILLLT